MKKLLIILLCLLITIVYTSCNKNDVPSPRLSSNDSATIMGFKDSTQLIKSIREISYDSATNAITDSTITYFHYDTINRKITLSLFDYSDPGQANRDSFEYSYNNEGLLIHVENKSSQITTEFLKSEDIIYDADDVVKTVTSRSVDGTTLVYSMNKEPLAGGGYSLSWFDLLNAPDTAYYTVNFDNDNRVTSYYFYGNSDSLIYDAEGNISRVMETVYLTPYSLTGADTFPLYDFVSRDTKGDQLYNLNRIMYNGISNFPAETSFGVADEFQYQYTKYPALSTKINRPASGAYEAGGGVYLINFSSTPEYDSKNRLVKYKAFFNDIKLSYLEYVISYYK
ncbi:MAG TPA: hypothetical protein VN726_08340 [Hanamia sp.]|nr:hypothetical protein [Hanamia sp.]